MEKLMGKPSKKLYCFTPEVMLATFVIEGILAAYTFVRYRMSAFGRLAAFTILVLASFQLSEYLVCTGESQLLWSRIGFVGITLLPVLGIHLISFMTGDRRFLLAAYAFAAVFIAGFIFSPTALTGAVCMQNYIVFLTAHELWLTYTVYYFGFLFAGLWNGVSALVRRAGETDQKRSSAIIWFLIGYLSFLIPMGVVYFAYPETRNAVPSIMCGFALLYALALSLRVVPLNAKSR